MIELNRKKVLEYIKVNPYSSSSKIHKELNLGVTLISIKRLLSKLVDENLLDKEGRGRATKYIIGNKHKLFRTIDIESYFEEDADDRVIIEHFNINLIANTLSDINLFTDLEINHLKSLQNKYVDNISTISNTLYKKDLERLGIDLSWKSSQIEGNTYSLLETEQLLKEKVEAKGKRKEEAIMLLNHKSALDYILDSPNYFLKIDLKKIVEVHSLLVDKLDVEKNIRKRIIGITGTNYKPLDNEHQIKEAIEQTSHLVNTKENIFEKAFITLLLLSYIQAFEDGNKRTARIMSNAVLISNNYCPISFRTVDSIDYKKAMLIFYEQNNISAFKKIFIEQYEFAVNTYFQ
ncbi:MAG: Fic family protein [Flavobacteriales bacterium]|nr:Fic family protein [Flavobacteriales bacterium]